MARYLLFAHYASGMLVLSTSVFWHEFLSQVPIYGVCAQKLACLPSEHGERLWQRETSWMQWTRSSRDTRSSVQHPSTWSTTKSAVLLHSASLPKKNLESSYRPFELGMIWAISMFFFHLNSDLPLLGLWHLLLFGCIAYRIILFLWVSPYKLVKVYQTMLCYNIIQWLFLCCHCNLPGIWKLVVSFCFPVCLFIMLNLEYDFFNLSLSGDYPFHVQN